MLLSTDIQQHYQERNNVNWSRGYASLPYRTTRQQRRKDSSSTTRNNVPTDPKYICNRCGKTYKALTSLSRHRRLECGVVPCEVCPICDRRFKHRFVLNSHVVGCQRRLGHIMQKKSDSPYMPDDREEYLSSIEEDPLSDVKCKFDNIGDPSSTLSSSSTVNQRNENTQSDDQQYLCGECGKGYKTMSNLMRHQRYECDHHQQQQQHHHHTQMGLDGWMIKQEDEDYGTSPHSFLQMVQTVDYNDSTTIVKRDLRENAKVTGNLTDDSHHHYRHHHHHHHHGKESEICEVPFHGQLTMNYLLCDSSILNPVEPSIVQTRTSKNITTAISNTNPSNNSNNNKSCQQFRCDGCGRTYTRVDSLKRHQQKCDDLLSSLQDRQDNSERLQQQEFSCNQCGRSYKRLDTLRRHQRLVCADKDSVHSVIKTDKTS
ncbi:hypothetical protein M0802_013592 [Mischocyttarus mexicanus]|nr:hypothetical protein M0802_013592 [Mischocyttarus mexicanus]